MSTPKLDDDPIAWMDHYSNPQSKSAPNLDDDPIEWMNYYSKPDYKCSPEIGERKIRNQYGYRSRRWPRRRRG